MMRWIGLVWMVGMALAGCSAKGPQVPAVAREFRAAWVASVNNIDWPSRPGLDSKQQQREIVAILDRAVELKLNAIILQVRTSCDALYPSNLEPWSEYLTGVQGKPPAPFYDPLEVWVEEAHRRGLELHAWFNPFRARQKGSKGEESVNHVSRAHPEWVRQYGDYLWLDPGNAEAQQHSMRVFMDVVRRYDIDGVHIDDYFYPYPLKGIEFPDGASWEKYVSGGGKLGRSDWRRENINRFIERLYWETKREKPWVKVGVSPFGIWRPGHPAGIVGFDPYESLYADAKLWLNNGWCDYFTPQLYWKISATKQAYPTLLEWWLGENLQGRHIWPGNYTSRIADGKANWEAGEIRDQIMVTRQHAGATGNVHFSMKALMQDRGGIVDVLEKGSYAEAAVVPASPWLGMGRPEAPEVEIGNGAGGVSVMWKARGEDAARVWVVYARYGQVWKSRVVPGEQMECVLAAEGGGGRPDFVAVSAVDRRGNESPRIAKAVGRP